MSFEGFHYQPGFLSKEEQAELLGALEALEFYHDRFRGRRMRRAYAQFGHRYTSTGRQLTVAPPLPDFLRILAERIQSCFGQAPIFDQCIVTRYPAGAGIGWHVDAPQFEDFIAGLSVGCDATMLFRPNDDRGRVSRQLLAAGSLYCLEGAARWDTQHSISKVPAQRYSLTFRRLK